MINKALLILMSTPAGIALAALACALAPPRAKNDAARS